MKYFNYFKIMMTERRREPNFNGTTATGAELLILIETAECRVHSGMNKIKTAQRDTPHSQTPTTDICMLFLILIFYSSSSKVHSIKYKAYLCGFGH
jgi:hypothetical protein